MDTLSEHVHDVDMFTGQGKSNTNRLVAGGSTLQGMGGWLTDGSRQYVKGV